MVAEDGRLLLADLTEVADDGRPDGAEPGRWPTAARSTCSPSSGCSVGWLRPIRCIQAGVGLLVGAELGRPRPTAALRTGADAGRPGRIGGRLEDAAAIPSGQQLRRKQRSSTKCRRPKRNTTERTATQRTNRNTTPVSLYLSRMTHPCQPVARVAAGACDSRDSLQCLHACDGHQKSEIRDLLECASLSWALLQIHRPGHWWPIRSMSRIMVISRQNEGPKVKP